jgi:hypothetical protein
MTSASEIAETVQSGVLKAIEATQRLTLEAVGAVTSTIDSYLPERPAVPFAAGLVSPQEVIDRGFGFAERLLSSQRAFLSELVATAAKGKDAKAA